MKTQNKLQGRRAIVFEIVYQPKGRPGITVTEAGPEAPIVRRLRELARMRQPATVMQVVPVKYVAEKGNIESEIEASVLDDWGEQVTRQIAGAVTGAEWKLDVMFAEGRPRGSKFATVKGTEE